MKKIVMPLTLILLVICGCASTKIEMNISKWMFDDSLNYDAVEKQLGEPDLSTDKVLEYSDWQLNNDISGTLSFKKLEDSDISIHWKFTTTINGKQYNSLHDTLKTHFKELTKYHETKTQDGISCIFLTSYDAPNYDDYVYSIRLSYLNDRVTIEWGSITSPKQ